MPTTTAPAIPTSQTPAGQPSTPPAALGALPEVPLPEPGSSRILTAIAQMTPYAMPLPSAASRSNVLSDFSGTVTEQRMEQPPERVAREPDRHDNQHHLAKRLMRDRLQRAALVGGLAAGADREL